MTTYPPFHEQIRYERESRNWSQPYLAEKVGCDAKTVARWEQGKTLPRPYYRKIICKLFGKTAEELGLVKRRDTSADPVDSSTVADVALASLPETSPTFSEEAATANSASAGNSSLLRSDWDDAPHVTHVHGRERECEELAGWLEDLVCRVVAIVGMGGIGKTTLATVLAREMEGKFAAVFWRSLHNVPPLEPVLQQCLRAVSAQPLNDLPTSVEEQIAALIEALRRHRCLLVLDNVESILQEGRPSGQYREGYEMYRELIRRIAETQHQSCLLLTSREKPQEVARFAGQQSPVRSLELAGIEDVAGRELLSDRQLSGSDDEWAELVHRYAGNPLALQLVAEPIRQVFGGKIAPFLHTEASAFGGINTLLAQQFQRLSQEERAIMYWLAIEREPVSLEEIGANLAQPMPGGTLVELLDSLRRRSMIENRSEGHFALQPVILEYVTGNLVEQACREFSATGALWISHALMKASSKDYVRNNQLRLLLMPVAQRLEAALGKKGVAQTARSILATQRQQRALQPGYLAGNLLNLLSYLQYDLRDFDFSDLVIRQACLQQVPLPGVNFSHSHFLDTTFTNAFGNVLSVACDPRRELFAVGTTTGDIRVYRLQQGIPTLTCSGHSDGVWSVAFSPDGKLLASSSDDHTIRLWDASTGDCIAILSDHDDRVRAVAFSPDGKLLASGSDDHAICLWDVGSGQCLKTLRGHSDRVWSVAFSPDGNVLASGSTDQTICLWNWRAGTALATLTGHSGWIRSVSFHADGRLLASGSDDQTVRLWDAQSGECRAVLRGHSSRVWSVAFGPDRQTLASSSEDQTIRLWDIASSECLKILQGHVHGVRSIAFSPRDHILVSGGDDQSCRIWNADTGYCLDRLQGYTNRIWSIVFSPHGRQLASVSEDQKLLLWDAESGQRPRRLTDNTHGALILAFSPDGQMIAGGGQDETIHLWDARNGRNLKTLRGHSNWIRALAFSPGGNLLASGSEDYTIRIWHVQKGQQLCKLEGHGSWIRAVAFCPDGTQLASGGDDQCVRIWDVESGECLKTLREHTSRVRSVAFSPAGSLLATSGEDQVIRLWDENSGECTGVLEGHEGWVRWIAFSPDGSLLVSGSEDQTVRLWNVKSGECLRTLRGHASRVRCVAFSPRGTIFASSGDDGTIMLWNTRSEKPLKTLIGGRPYEGMNIFDARGLTEAQKAALLALGAVEEDRQ